MIRLHFLILIGSLFCALSSWAQAPQGAPPGGESEDVTEYNLGVKTGSFLPYGIPGVRNLLPVWGVKLGHSMSKNVHLEYDFDASNAKGVTYYIAYFSVRYNFSVLDSLPLFFTAGVDANIYKRINTQVTNTEFPLKTVTGWHIGFGGETHLFSDMYFRVDMRLGFSPGRQMSLLGGLVLKF